MVNCPGTVDFTNPHTPSTTGTFSANGQYALRLTACDGELSSSADVRMTVNPISSGQGLPPDPRTVAPSLNQTVATDLKTSTEFLYTGTDPIQTGVTPGTIELRRREQIANSRPDVGPEIPETIPKEISWHGYEMFSSGSPVFAPDIGPTRTLFTPVIGLERSPPFRSSGAESG